MRYWPEPSVTTERVFSISAGLAASTVTPGRTPPEESLTTPAICACAKTVEGIAAMNNTAQKTCANLLMADLLARKMVSLRRRGGKSAELLRPGRDDCQ